ncbi:MAG: hypothetical protein IJU23_14375 [Proteobacteria bacterium]|nr:hypothetical protein [Pseudomonadota bacterium]
MKKQLLMSLFSILVACGCTLQDGIESCTNTQYYDNSTGLCVTSDIDHCGMQDYICLERVPNWSKGLCFDNVCVVTECTTGFRPATDARSCVSDCTGSQYYDSSTASCKPSDIDNCGQAGYKCSERISNWKTGKCTDNVCSVTACNDGYSIVNNECKADCGNTKYYNSATGACANSDTDNCGQKDYKCSEHIANWSTGNCTNNVCVVTSCGAGHIPSEDGKQCVDDDVAKCEAGCANHPFANIKSYYCTEHDGELTCAYVCTDSMVNCGTQFNPDCIDINTNFNHCGKCNQPCVGNQHCDNGSCQYTACQPTQCTVMTGAEMGCTNTDEKCGNSCISCKSLHANGFCDNGSCFISACNAGEHPLYNGDGKITQCVANTEAACAPKDLPSGQSVVNCNDWKPSNATTTSCDASSGVCIVTACSIDYHIAPDGKTCVKNTSASCGAYNSSETKSCTGPANVCNNGQCECPAGKLLNYDGNNCVIPVCAGIPGVYEGTERTYNYYNESAKDFACNPTKCNSNYESYVQNGAHSCRPYSSLGCDKYGYLYTNSVGVCTASNGSSNGHAHCKDGYRYYILACIAQDYCCGTRNLNMNNASDFVCRNCKVQGKTCDISTGECK